MLVGKQYPPKSAARSTNSTTIHTFTTPTSHSQRTPRTQPPGDDPAPNPHPTHDTPRQLVVTLLEELLTTLCSKCIEKTSVSLLGRIHGKYLGSQLGPKKAHSPLSHYYHWKLTTCSKLLLHTQKGGYMRWTKPTSHVDWQPFFLYLALALRPQDTTRYRQTRPPSLGSDCWHVPSAMKRKGFVHYRITDRACHLSRKLWGV